MGNLKNMRIMVTGGNGYLGSHLSGALETLGAKVFILDLVAGKNNNTCIVDMSDELSVKKAVKDIKPRIVYHLAAVLKRERSFEYHDQIMKVNYFGTVNLLRALQGIEYERFIFTSTSEVYGNNPVPFHEKQIPDPCSPYSLSKLFAEQTIKTFSTLHKKNFTILRLFNFFGKNMPDNFFMPQLTHSLQHNIPFDMTGGEQVRDYLFVDDVVTALILSATHEKSANEIFNVCSGVGISLKDLVAKLKKKLNTVSLVNIGALPYRENEIWNMAGSNIKIKRLLGFVPKICLDEAIELLIL